LEARTSVDLALQEVQVQVMDESSEASRIKEPAKGDCVVPVAAAERLETAATAMNVTRNNEATREVNDITATKVDRSKATEIDESAATEVDLCAGTEVDLCATTEVDESTATTATEGDKSAAAKGSNSASFITAMEDLPLEQNSVPTTLESESRHISKKAKTHNFGFGAQCWGNRL